jgi:hypothetical protein
MLNYRKLLNSFFAFSILVLLPASACFAQATRTWVSGVGDDANPCSRTAPCKTFAGAISKTAAGGIISVLDPGGFGAVTITKAITIESVSDWGGILSSLTNGVIVNAGVNDTVTLRSLSIDGAGTGTNGVRFLAGAKLVVDNCYIAGAATGIDFEPAAASKLQVINTTINNTSANAVLIQAGAAGTASASLEKTRLTNGSFGLKVNKGAVSLKDSFIANIAQVGVKAFGVTSAAQITVDNTLVSDSGTGVNAQGSLATIFISGSTITNNATGISSSNSAVLTSFGNNRFIGNTVDGNPTSTIATR